MLLLTSAPAGSNIYVCLTANNWVTQGGVAGTLTIQNGGSIIAARATENFVPGAGITNVITDLGTKINIQQSVDTSTIVSKASLQSGQPLLCQSTSGSSTAFTCGLQPALTAYTTGMVLYWRPDVGSTSAAITLDIDLLGATPVRLADGITIPSAADLVAGQLYAIWFDGTIFRLIGGLASGGGSSGGGGGTPTSLTSTTAGGPTTIVAASEWHAPLAACSGVSTATLTWDIPPAGNTAATAGGCAGSNLHEAFGVFPNAGTPSAEISLTLPRTLTGNADVFLNYQTSIPGGTFTPALDVVCTPGDGSQIDDPPFTANNFFAPGPTIAPATANAVGTAMATGLNWPAGCVGGARAHFRLIRTDTAGTAASVGIIEAVVVLRRQI